jgi:hypothetical protein
MVSLRGFGWTTVGPRSARSGTATGVGRGWLEMLLTRQRADEGAQSVARAAVGLDLLAVTGEHRQLEASAMALANELADRLHCDRVSIGIVNRRRNGVRLKAMSINFARKTSLGLQPVACPAQPRTQFS